MGRERGGTQTNKVKKDMKEKKSVGKKKKKMVGNEKLGKNLCGKNEISGGTYSDVRKRRYIVLFLYLFFCREGYGVLLIIS